MTCRHCNREIPDNAVFCPYCGQPVTPPEVFCTGCGEKLKEGFMFCPICGTPVKGARPTPRPDPNSGHTPNQNQSYTPNQNQDYSGNRNQEYTPPRNDDTKQGTSSQNSGANTYGAWDTKTVTVNYRTGKGNTAFSQSAGSLTVSRDKVSFSSMMGSKHNHSYPISDIVSTVFAMTRLGLAPEPGYTVTLRDGRTFTYIYSPFIKGKLREADSMIQSLIRR